MERESFPSRKRREEEWRRTRRARNSTVNLPFSMSQSLHPLDQGLYRSLGSATVKLRKRGVDVRVPPAQLLDRPLIEPQQLCFGDRGNRGGARTPRQQGDLSKEISGPELGKRDLGPVGPAREHSQTSLNDQEEGVSRLSLANDGRAGRDLDRCDQREKSRQLLARNA